MWPGCCHSFPGAHRLIVTVVVCSHIVFSSLWPYCMGEGRTAAGCTLGPLWMWRGGIGIWFSPRNGCISAAATNDFWLVGSAACCGYSGLQRGQLGRDGLIQIKSCWKIGE